MSIQETVLQLLVIGRWLLKLENNSAAYINLSIKGIRSYFFSMCVPHLTPLEMVIMDSTLFEYFLPSHISDSISSHQVPMRPHEVLES